MGQTLIAEFLPPDLPQDILESTGGEPVPHTRPGTTLSDLEHEAIQRCLYQTGGNRQQTAQRLGISTRTLLRKIREYELDDPLRSTTPDPDETLRFPEFLIFIRLRRRIAFLARPGRTQPSLPWRYVAPVAISALASVDRLSGC